MRNLQIPNHFKKVGVAIAIISFVTFFFTAKGGDFRMVGKYGLLVGMLLISISKEKIEDELIVKLRMQSYTFAFIVGVIYALLLPFVDYLVDAMVEPKIAEVKNMGDFMILWMLLSVQIFSFKLLKRRA